LSYGYVSYLIDLPQLRSVLGTNDVALRARIEEKMSEHLDELDELFEDEIEEGALSVRDALAELLGGSQTDPEGSANQYCYAFEALCDVLGEQLIENALTQLSVQWIGKEVPEIEVAWGFDRPWSSDFLPEPQPFPALAFVRHTDLQRALEVVEAGKRAPGRSPEALRCLEGCSNVLRRAISKGKDLAVFLY
jgi:hypothetical protein